MDRILTQRFNKHLFVSFYGLKSFSEKTISAGVGSEVITLLESLPKPKLGKFSQLYSKK